MPGMVPPKNQKISINYTFYLHDIDGTGKYIVISKINVIIYLISFNDDKKCKEPLKNPLAFNIHYEAVS